MAEPPIPPGGAPNATDRRRNPTLRELLDELIELVRRLSREAPTLEAEQLEYSQQRIEWLADEIWEEISRTARGQRPPSP
jgi:hypothetical protein